MKKLARCFIVGNIHHRSLGLDTSNLQPHAEVFSLFTAPTYSQSDLALYFNEGVRELLPGSNKDDRLYRTIAHLDLFKYIALNSDLTQDPEQFVVVVEEGCILASNWLDKLQNVFVQLQHNQIAQQRTDLILLASEGRNSFEPLTSEQLAAQKVVAQEENCLTISDPLAYLPQQRLPLMHQMELEIEAEENEFTKLNRPMQLVYPHVLNYLDHQAYAIRVGRVVEIVKQLFTLHPEQVELAAKQSFAAEQERPLAKIFDFTPTTQLTFEQLNQKQQLQLLDKLVSSKLINLTNLNQALVSDEHGNLKLSSPFVNQINELLQQPNLSQKLAQLDPLLMSLATSSEGYSQVTTKLGEHEFNISQRQGLKFHAEINGNLLKHCFSLKQKLDFTLDMWQHLLPLGIGYICYLNPVLAVSKFQNGTLVLTAELNTLLTYQKSQQLTKLPGQQIAIGNLQLITSPWAYRQQENKFIYLASGQYGIPDLRKYQELSFPWKYKLSVMTQNGSPDQVENFYGETDYYWQPALVSNFFTNKQARKQPFENKIFNFAFENELQQGRRKGITDLYMYDNFSRYSFERIYESWFETYYPQIALRRGYDAVAQIRKYVLGTNLDPDRLHEFYQQSDTADFIPLFNGSGSNYFTESYSRSFAFHSKTHDGANTLLIDRQLLAKNLAMISLFQAAVEDQSMSDSDLILFTLDDVKLHPQWRENLNQCLHSRSQLSPMLNMIWGTVPEVDDFTKEVKLDPERHTAEPAMRFFDPLAYNPEQQTIRLLPYHRFRGYNVDFLIFSKLIAKEVAANIRTKLASYQVSTKQRQQLLKAIKEYLQRSQNNKAKATKTSSKSTPTDLFITPQEQLWADLAQLKDFRGINQQHVTFDKAEQFGKLVDLAQLTDGQVLAIGLPLLDINLMEFASYTNFNQFSIAQVSPVLGYRNSKELNLQNNIRNTLIYGITDLSGKYIKRQQQRAVNSNTGGLGYSVLPELKLSQNSLSEHLEQGQRNLQVQVGSRMRAENKRYLSLANQVIVTLPHSTDRQEEFFQQVPPEAWLQTSGVYGKYLSEDELNQRFDVQGFEERYKRVVAKGEIGCTLSHLEIYRKTLSDYYALSSPYFLTQGSALVKAAYALNRQQLAPLANAQGEVGISAYQNKNQANATLATEGYSDNSDLLGQIDFAKFDPNSAEFDAQYCKLIEQIGFTPLDQLDRRVPESQNDWIMVVEDDCTFFPHWGLRSLLAVNYFENGEFKHQRDSNPYFIQCNNNMLLDEEAYSFKRLSGNSFIRAPQSSYMPLTLGNKGNQINSLSSVCYPNHVVSYGSSNYLFRRRALLTDYFRQQRSSFGVADDFPETFEYLSDLFVYNNPMLGKPSDAESIINEERKIIIDEARKRKQNQPVYDAPPYLDRWVIVIQQDLTIAEIQQRWGKGVQIISMSELEQLSDQELIEQYFDIEGFKANYGGQLPSRSQAIRAIKHQAAYKYIYSLYNGSNHTYYLILEDSAIPYTNKPVEFVNLIIYYLVTRLTTETQLIELSNSFFDQNLEAVNFDPSKKDITYPFAFEASNFVPSPENDTYDAKPNYFGFPFSQYLVRHDLLPDVHVHLKHPDELTTEDEFKENENGGTSVVVQTKQYDINEYFKIDIVEGKANSQSHAYILLSYPIIYSEISKNKITWLAGDWPKIIDYYPTALAYTNPPLFAYPSTEIRKASIGKIQLALTPQ